VRKRHKSKRLTFKNKYKIERKVKEHHRKLRRLARQNPTKKRRPKTIAIPNSYPGKKDMLIQLAELEEVEKIEQREEQTNDLKRKREEMEKKDDPVVVVQEEILDDATIIFREFRNAINQSDVILEVIDARDPLGTRSISVEKQILEIDPNKIIILVLNKIDLVPKDVVKQWLNYLKNFFPTILFKSKKIPFVKRKFLSFRKQQKKRT